MFPDPKGSSTQLHKDHFRVVLHAVILADKLRGNGQRPMHAVSIR